MIIVQRENLTLVGGVVKRLRHGASKGGVKVCNVVLEGEVYNKNSRSSEKKLLDVAFWNSESSTDQRADRIVKAGVGPGSYITALVVMKDDTNATGYNFKYSGKWSFPEALKKSVPEEEKQKAVNLFSALQKDGFIANTMTLDVNNLESVKSVCAECLLLMNENKTPAAKELRTALNSLFFTEQNVIIGTIANFDDYGNMVKVTIPVTNNRSETVWNKVSFRNTETAAMADRAKKCLTPRSDGAKVRAVLTCGPMELYNGKPNYRGFKFDLIPNPPK